jgi:parallel beta-helix repeat protein
MEKRNKIICIAAVVGLFLAIGLKAQDKIVNAQDFITGEDATAGVCAAIEFCKKTGAGKLIFPPGKYDFKPDYATEKYLFISNNDGSLKRIAFDCSGMKNFEIDGQGALFVFHGFIVPFLLDNAQHIKIKNLSIDYSRTFHSEGRILKVYDDSIDVCFSPDYPYKIDHNILIFTDDEKRIYPWNSLLEFDPRKKETAYKVVDYWCGPNIPVKELAPGKIRLHHPNIKATEGNVMAFGASHRLIPAFFLNNCRQTVFSRINIFHCGGMGIIAQLSENISIDSVRVTPTPDSDRVISITADATHFVNCKGKINITNCLFENQKDDAANIHGLYARIDQLISPSELRIRMVHPQQAGVDFIFPGEDMELVESESLISYETNTVKNVKRINNEYTNVSFIRPFSKKIKKGDGIAALNTQPEVLIKNCTIRGNRARGILLGSRAKILIQNNYFHTAGAAILLEGDCRFWYEQAGVRDLTVKNNIFDNCFYGTWGNAIIQVGSGISEDKKNIARYNRNILIEDNLFRIFTPEILNLYSVENLVFRKNTIEKTTDYHSAKKDGNPFIIAHSSHIKIE